MNEDLHFACFGTGTNIIQRTFSREDCAAVTQLLSSVNAFGTVHGGLSGQMYLKIGQVISYDFAKAKVLDDQSVHTHLVKPGGIFKSLREILIIHQGVHRDIGLNASQMTVVQSFLHLFKGEVACADTCIKKTAA